MRRIFAALLCAALVFPTAVTAAPIDKPAPVLTAPTVGEGHCEDAGGHNDHVGWEKNPTGGFTNFRGIRSLIFDRADLRRCQTSPDIINGPSYWVALVPGPGNPYYNNTNAILQIGVINCVNLIVSACQAGPRYFWAGGGCGFEPIPRPVDLGPADPGGVTFAVRHVGNSTYWLTAQPQVGALEQLYTDDSNAKINCWAFGDGPVSAIVSCERWDRGDNCGGNTAADKIDFTTVRYQVSVDGQWYIPGPNNTHGISVSCNVDTMGAEGFCSSTSEALKTWVVQQ